MPAVVIAQLLAQFGPVAVNLIDRLIVLWQQKTDVTPDQWAQLRSIVLTPEDALAKVAAAAGLQMSDPKIVAISQLIAPPVVVPTTPLQG